MAQLLDPSFSEEDLVFSDPEIKPDAVIDALACCSVLLINNV